MAVSSTTKTNRKALADALAAINNNPPVVPSRTTPSKIEEVARNLTVQGYGTNVSPTFQSYDQRVPSYGDIGRRLEKTGAIGTGSFTNNWMTPRVVYGEQEEERPKSLFGVSKLNPLNYISGTDILYGIGKPLSGIASFVDVAFDYVDSAWRSGDLNPFDKESWSLDALNREWDRTKNIVTDWNRQTGTGIGDSEWNSIYTFGEVLRDQNWLQGDVLGWDGSELTIIPDFVPVLPSYKQRVSPSGLVGTVLNIWADPLTGIRNVGLGADVATSLASAGQKAQQAVTRNAYRNSYLEVLAREGVDVTDKLILDSVEDVVNRSTSQFFLNGGVQTSAAATRRNLLNGMVPLTVEGQQYAAGISNNLLSMVQDLGVTQAKLLSAGRSNISSAEMNRVGAIAQKLGVNSSWQTQKEFSEFVASMAAQNRPVANNFQRLVNFGVNTSDTSGALSTTVGWRLTGTGPAGRGIINSLNRTARRVVNSNGHRVRETLDDFMTEPIALQFFSTNNPGLDLLMRSPGMGFQRIGRGISGSKLGEVWRRGLSGRGFEFKETIRNGHHKVPLGQRSAPGEVIKSKEALRAMSRGTQMGRKADGVFDTLRRGWQDTVIPILRQKLPGVADAELGAILRQATANPDAKSFEYAGVTVVLKDIKEAIDLTKKFAREVGEEAHRLGGDEFLSFIDDWTPRILTDEAAEAIGKRWAAQNYTPRGSFAKSGMEMKRTYVSPAKYLEELRKFAESKGVDFDGLSGKKLQSLKKEYNQTADSVSDEFIGHKFLEPNEKGYKYGDNPGPETPAPDVETQIADIMQASGMDHRLFEENLFTAMASYTSGLAKRTGDAWAETLMLRSDVLTDTDGWITSAYFPTPAQVKAAATLRSASVKVERARKDLVNRVRIAAEEGDLNKAFNDEAIASLEKILIKAVDEEADAFKAVRELEVKRADAETVRIRNEERVIEIGKIVNDTDAEIAALRAKYAGDDSAFTKAELKRVRRLEEEKQRIQNERLSLEMGKGAAKGYQDGLYYAQWDEARNAVAAKFLLERGITKTAFKDVDQARQFAKWFKEEFEEATAAYLDPDATQARGLLPDQSLDDFAEEAAIINQAQNDPTKILMTAEGNIPPEVRYHLMNTVFKSTDELGNDVSIPAAVGVKAFEDAARIFDQEGVGEWLVLQDIDRFLPGIMGEYRGAPVALLSALDLIDETIEGSLSVLDDMVGRALDAGVDLPAVTKYKLPTKENIAAANDVLERAAQMGELRLKIAQTSSGYGRVAEALGVRPAIANAPTTQEINEATRLLFSINGKTNLAAIDDISDLNAMLDNYAEALLRRQGQLEIAIGASPVGELTIPVPGTVNSDFELIGLPTYVSQKQFQEAYQRGLQDGSQMRMRTTERLETIELNGRQVSPDELFDPSPNNPFAEMELTRRYAYAQNQNREVEFWFMPNARRLYEIERSTIYDPSIPDPVASAPVANAVYRELGIPVRDIAVEYKPGPFGSDNFIPSTLKQTDMHNHPKFVDSDELAGSQTFINQFGEPEFGDALTYGSSIQPPPGQGVWTAYDSNSQIGQGFAVDLLLGNFSVGRDGSMFVDKLGRLTRGDMFDTFGHRGGTWVDDLPRETPAGRVVDPDELDLQAQMLDEMVELPEIIETLPVEQIAREGFSLQELIDDGWRTADGTGFSDDYVLAIRGWIDSLTREGLDFKAAFAQQVDNILGLRSKYGGWKAFVAQHGDLLGVAKRDQAEYMVNFLETRTKELADMSGLKWFEAGSDDMLRSHAVRMGVDPEIISNTNRDELLHLIRTENGGHGTLKGGPVPHTISPDVLGRPGLDAGHAWGDGTALNLTLSPVAYGSKFSTIAQDAMVYRQFVLDLSGGGKVRFYGQDPWREEAARQLLLRMGKDPVSDTSTLDDFLNSLDILGNQASRPYGFVDESLNPRALVEGQAIFEPLPSGDYAGGTARGFDSGLGEIAVDIMSRVNDDTLDQLIGFVSPKQTGALLDARSAPWDINDDAYFRLAEIIRSKGGPSRVRASDIPDEKVKMWRKESDELSAAEANKLGDEDYFEWMQGKGKPKESVDVYEEVSLRELWKQIRSESDNSLSYQEEWVNRHFHLYSQDAAITSPRSRTEVYARDPGIVPQRPLPPELGAGPYKNVSGTLMGASRPSDYNFFQASTNAFIEAKSLTASPRFARYFAQTGSTKKPLQNALEFIGWRDMTLRRKSQGGFLGDANLLPASSDNLEDLVFKFFRATDPEINPTHYAINQAAASRGAARQSDTLLRGVYQRYFQMQTRAGHLQELGSFQSFRKATRDVEGKELSELVTNSPYDALVPRPHLAKTPETSLVSRMMNEYHLSLAADGYGGTAWLNHIDDVGWSSYADDLFPNETPRIRADEALASGATPSSPMSNYFVNVTATNPYVLRPNFDIDNLVSGTPITEMDQVIKDGIVDSRRLLELFEHRAENVLTAPPKSRSQFNDPLRAAVEGQQVAMRTLAEVNMEYDKALGRLNEIRDTINTTTAQQETINSIRIAAEEKIENLRKAIETLERIRTRPRSAVGADLPDSFREFRAGGAFGDAGPSGNLVAPGELGDVIRSVGQPFEAPLPPGFATDLSAVEFKNLEDQIRQLAIGDLAELNNYLDVALADDVADAITRLEAAGPAVKIVKGMPQVQPAILTEVMERTLRSGIAPVGTRSQGTEGIVNGIMAFDTVAANGGVGRFIGYPKRGGYFDRTHNVMKGYMTASMGFLTRNAYGGMFMNWMAGVVPTRYGEFMRALMVANVRAAKEAAGDAPLTGAQRQLEKRVRGWSVPEEHVSYVRILQDQGAFGGTQTGIEVDPGLGRTRTVKVGGKEVDLSVANPFSGKFFILKGVRGANVHVETFLRGTLGLDRMIKSGGVVDNAMDDIWKYHFNYDDLSRFERSGVKRATSFYTWIRHAIPLVAQSYYKNPTLWQRYVQGMSTVADDDAKGWDEMAPWLRRQGAVPIGWEYGGNNLTFSPDVPIRSFFDMVSPIFEKDKSIGQRLGIAPSETGGALTSGLSMLNPMLKSPAEYVTKRNFWKGYNYDGRYERVPWQLAGIPGFMESMEGFFGGDKHDAEMYYDEEGEFWAMKDSLLASTFQLLPPLNTMRRLFPDEKRFQERAISSWISWLSGAGLRTNTDWEIEKTRRSDIYQQLDERDSMEDRLRLRAETRAGLN